MIKIIVNLDAEGDLCPPQCPLSRAGSHSWCKLQPEGSLPLTRIWTGRDFYYLRCKECKEAEVIAKEGEDE